MSRVRTRTFVTIEEQRPYVHTHRAPPNLSYGGKSREVDLRGLGTSLPPRILQLLPAFISEVSHRRPRPIPSDARWEPALIRDFWHRSDQVGLLVPAFRPPRSSSPGPQQSHRRRWSPQTPASPGLEAARLLRPAGVAPCPPGFPELGHCPPCREGQLSL